MKFSAQEEYGLRLLIQIAQMPGEESITIPELARREELSEPHVAKLLMILRKGGFVKSFRGQSGGYVLAGHAKDIVVGAVLEELGGRLVGADFCERHSGLAEQCPHVADCALGGLWDDVQKAVDSVLQHRTLQDLLDGAEHVIRLGTIPGRRTEAAGR